MSDRFSWWVTSLGSVCFSWCRTGWIGLVYRGCVSNLIPAQLLRPSRVSRVSETSWAAKKDELRDAAITKSVEELVVMGPWDVPDVKELLYFLIVKVSSGYIFNLGSRSLPNTPNTCKNIRQPARISDKHSKIGWKRNTLQKHHHNTNKPTRSKIG